VQGDEVGFFPVVFRRRALDSALHDDVKRVALLALRRHAPRNNNQRACVWRRQQQLAAAAMARGRGGGGGFALPGRFLFTCVMT
jgi:anti-sigma factor RsiW